MILVGVLALFVVGVLSWWQEMARRQGWRSPAEQALLTILTPALQAGTLVRNLVTPPPSYALHAPEQLPRTGMDQLGELQAENQRLTSLLALQSALPHGAIACAVIGRNVNPWQGDLLLDKGAAEGVQPHMLALTPDGVLGQVATVTAHTAQILLLTDPAAGIGAMLLRSRETGVLKGYRQGQCQLIYLPDTAQIQPGDEVVTSGLGDYFPKNLGTFFPKGLPLGTVISVQEDPSLSSRTALITPAANPATVETVVVTK
jgi:rod shape-determining protein MreC